MGVSRKVVPTWRKGEFVDYRAVVTFHIGGDVETKINDGDIVSFDGYNAVIGQDEYYNTKIRGAVKAGWLVPEESEVTSYVPRKAGIQYTPADDTKKSQKPKDTQEVRAMEVHIDEDEAVSLRPEDQGRASRSKEAAVDANEGSTVKLGRRLAPANAGTVDASSQGAIDRAIRDTNKAVEAKSSPEDVENRRQTRASSGAIEFDKSTELNEIFEDEDPSVVFADDSGGLVRTSVGIDWNLDTHWRTRAKEATDRFGSSKEILKSIIEVEKSDGVIKVIKAHLKANF